MVIVLDAPLVGVSCGRHSENRPLGAAEWERSGRLRRPRLTFLPGVTILADAQAFRHLRRSKTIRVLALASTTAASPSPVHVIEFCSQP